MFYGLTNCPATFQAIMNNILIFGGQTKEHRHTIVEWVLDILHKHQLYLKAEKCMFRQSMVEYLGLILSEGCIEMDPSRWPAFVIV